MNLIVTIIQLLWTWKWVFLEMEECYKTSSISTQEYLENQSISKFTLRKKYMSKIRISIYLRQTQPVVFLPNPASKPCKPSKKMSSFGYLGFVLSVINAIINTANNINNNQNNNNNNVCNILNLWLNKWLNWLYFQNNINNANNNNINIANNNNNVNTMNMVAAGREISQEELELTRKILAQHHKKVNHWK